MSAIAALFNVPSTEAELASWSFAHAAHHTDIIRVIYQTTGKQLDSFVLDPFDINNPQVWLYQHQLVHNQQNAILQISGNDLLDVDFKEHNELAGWIFLNSSEHFQAANILGIG